MEKPVHQEKSSLKMPLQIRNKHAEKDLLEFSALSYPDITGKTLNQVQKILESGMINGDNPRTIALELVGRVDPDTQQRVGSVIGLPQQLIEEIKIATAYLEQLDTLYLSYELRDKLFDRTVKKAISRGNPLSKEKNAQIIQAYKSRALLHRGELIARTEIMRSINSVTFHSHKKAVENRTLDTNAITKEWVDCGDQKVRTSHAIMGETYGKGKGILLDEAFILPSGERLLHPGDTSLGAPFHEIEGCRCSVHYRVDWLI